MIDVILIAIVVGVTWAVAAEGAWGAGWILLCVLFSGLLAMNFFEPLAGLLETAVSSSPAWRARWDLVALVGLFGGFVFGFRLLGERLAPVDIEVHPLVYDIGRWGCGALTGYITMAFLLTALHTAPLPRTFWGFTPEPHLRNGPVSAMAPDFQWLGFTQHVSENVFRQPGGRRIFDGPRLRIGDYEGVWPSFPIRYATRRERRSSGSTNSSGGSNEAPNAETRPREAGRPDF